MSLFGDESLSLYLRCLASLELFEHAQYYANHPLLFGQNVNGEEKSASSILSALVSTDAPSFLDEFERTPAIIAEARNTAVNFSHSSFICLLALSSVIGLPIESYYPVKSERIVEICELVCNTTVIPHSESIMQTSYRKVHIFNCSHLPLDYLRTTQIPNTVEFFVPLLLLESDVAKFTLPSSLLTRSRESQRDSSATSAILHGKTGASSISKRKKLTILNHFSAKASKLNLDEAAFEIFATSSTEIHDFQSFSSTTPCTADQLPSLPSQMSKKDMKKNQAYRIPLAGTLVIITPMSII